MRFCLQPGCPAKVQRGYCQAHTRRKEQQRGNSNARGYTWQWSKPGGTAKRFLDRFPICGMRPGGQAPVMSQCHVDGLRTPATEVDHVIPHRGDPALFDDLDGNGQALCRSCHARKSQTERE
jgi:5-methylcytosine-specific restriction protein A